MTDLNEIFTCALSGVEAAEDEVLPDDYADELGLMPAGWTRITVERRLPNPEYTEVQQVMAGMVETTLQQVAEGDRPQARRPITLQVAAQFAALNADLDLFVTMREVIYVAPPEWDPVLAREFFDIRQRLGLPVPEDVEGEDVEDVEDIEEEAEDEAVDPQGPASDASLEAGA